MTNARIGNEERRPWYRRAYSRLGLGGSLLVGLLLVGMVTAAIAAILLRAEVTGGGVSGQAVAFEWGVSTDGGLTAGDGVLTSQYMVDTDSDGIYDSSVPVPSPLTCDIAVVNGTLSIDMAGGWLPGEACGLINAGNPTTAYLTNPSSVDVDVIQWDFGSSNLSLDKDAITTSVELVQGDRSIGALYDDDGGLATSVPAGATVAAPLLIFELADTAPFGTPFVFDTAAVIGETTR